MLSSDTSNPAAKPVGSSRIAALVPCYNEEAVIGRDVADFRAAVPDAAVSIYDNNSIDRTVEAAANAAAIVRRETHRGKGRVVRRMFTDVDAHRFSATDIRQHRRLERIPVRLDRDSL